MTATSKCGLGVLVSGNGTNLQAIMDACENPSYPAEIKIVVSDNPEAYALVRAEKKGLPVAVVPYKKFTSREEFERALTDLLNGSGVNLVVLAGFMRLLSPSFVARYPNRILNIHPSLLPAFPGMHAIRKAWEAGVTVAGVTVHFVDEGTDTGPIVLQEAIPIGPKETLESLEEKVHSVEHRLFPKAIRLYAEGKLDIKGQKVFVSEVS